MGVWIGKNMTRPPASDNTKPLEKKCAELEQENAMLKQQVQALSEQTEFHESIFIEMAETVYA